MAKCIDVWQSFFRLLDDYYIKRCGNYTTLKDKDIFLFLVEQSNAEDDSMAKTPGEKTRLHRQQSTVNLNDLKVGVVWVENFDDIGNFPTEALLTNVTEQSPNFSLKDVVLVFVHVMSNELLKVKLVGHQGKLGKEISILI